MRHATRHTPHAPRTLKTAQHPDFPARGTNEAAGTRNAPERGGGPQLPGLTRGDPVGR